MTRHCSFANAFTQTLLWLLHNVFLVYGFRVALIYCWFSVDSFLFVFTVHPVWFPSHALRVGFILLALSTLMRCIFCHDLSLSGVKTSLSLAMPKSVCRTHFCFWRAQLASKYHCSFRLCRSYIEGPNMRQFLCKADKGNEPVYYLPFAEAGCFSADKFWVTNLPWLLCYKLWVQFKSSGPSPNSNSLPLPERRAASPGDPEITSQIKIFAPHSSLSAHLLNKKTVSIYFDEFRQVLGRRFLTLTSIHSPVLATSPWCYSSL